MKLVGAVLTALAGLLGGLLAAEEQRDTVRRCAALVRMLELTEFELTRFRTPLPELFAALGPQLEEPAAALCRTAAEGLARGEAFPICWKVGLTALPREEREILAPLGHILGRYGAEEQAAAVTACRRELERRGVRLQGELRDRSRIYIGVGAAGGVMLAVLLL